MKKMFYKKKNFTLPRYMAVFVELSTKLIEIRFFYIDFYTMNIYEI